MRKVIILVIISVSALIFLSWQLTGSAVTAHETVVTKVIDGDTVIIEGGQSVRLLGIDADEKNYPCYTEAKVALENLVLSRRVTLESDKEDKDKYGRLLRWIWLNDTLVNFEMVKLGLAVARFDSDSKYQEEITSAEQAAIAHHLGCKWSSLE
jgi:micrococcal nuclease